MGGGARTPRKSGADHVTCLTVSETSNVARFDLDAADNGADLDLFVPRSDSCSIDDAFDLDFYDVNAAATLGNLTVRPNPVPVTNQEPTSFELSWSGLVPNGRYLGYLDYEGAL